MDQTHLEFGRYRRYLLFCCISTSFSSSFQIRLWKYFRDRTDLKFQMKRELEFLQKDSTWHWQNKYVLWYQKLSYDYELNSHIYQKIVFRLICKRFRLSNCGAITGIGSSHKFIIKFFLSIMTYVYTYVIIPTSINYYLLKTVLL